MVLACKKNLGLIDVGKGMPGDCLIKFDVCAVLIEVLRKGTKAESVELLHGT